MSKHKAICYKHTGISLYEHHIKHYTWGNTAALNSQMSPSNKAAVSGWPALARRSGTAHFGTVLANGAHASAALGWKTDGIKGGDGEKGGSLFSSSPKNVSVRLGLGVG